MKARSVIAKLKTHANAKNVAGMARFGINPHTTLGVSIPVLRGMARDIGKDHALARQLWSTGIHEARLLAAFVEDPKLVTQAQMNVWVAQFDSWDVCDQVCSNVFDKTPFAIQKAKEWARDRREFVRRAGFVLMACLAVHDKKAGDTVFTSFFPLIKSMSVDERNFVKKAVNWALRQIGKRNVRLQKAAIKVAEDILKKDSPSARWIAADALRELRAKKFKKHT